MSIKIKGISAAQKAADIAYTYAMESAFIRLDRVEAPARLAYQERVAPAHAIYKAACKTAKATYKAASKAATK